MCRADASTAETQFDHENAFQSRLPDRHRRIREATRRVPAHPANHRKFNVVGRRSSVVRRRADQVNVPLTSSALRCPFCLGRRRTLWTVSIDRADLHVAEPLTVPDRRELLPASDIAGGAVTPRALGPPRARQGPPRCPYTTPPVGPRSSAECVDDDAHERPACPRWQEGQIGDQSRFGRSR